MQKPEISQKTLEWLLEDNNPPVRNLTKKYLQDKKLTDLEVKEVNNYSPIQSILSLMSPDGSWTDPRKPYRKYTGSYWQFIFLSDLNANPTSKTIQKAAENIFSYQLPTGEFPHELGFKKVPSYSAHDFFDVIAKRYEKGSVIITTNKNFETWKDIFLDDILSSAILDRIIHHSEIIKINGPSYRRKNLKKELSKK